MMKQKNLTTIFFLLILVIPLSLAVTVTGGGSSYTFSVVNCTSPQIGDELNCSPATIRYECDISDPAFIDNVTYRINGNDYLTQQNYSTPQQFYLYYNKPLDTTSTTTPISLQREQISDVNGHKLNAFEIVNINRTCIACPATYTLNPLTTCQINNTYQVEHVSSNETCSPSYNSTENCNYCSANIITNATVCSSTGTRSITYIDTNYSTCCLITGLSSDCIINTPTYAPINQTCDYLINNFSCSFDSTPIINKKMNIACELPTNDEYDCIVNVYQETNITSTLLATNPEYKKSSGSLLSLSQESEERTSFKTNGKLLNAYYTNKEIRPDDNFKIETICYNNNTKLINQKIVRPTYDTPDWTINRLVWFKNNTAFAIMTGIAIILIILAIAWVINKLRGR